MNQSEPKKEKKTPRELFEEIRRNQKPSPELIDSLRRIKRKEEEREKGKPVSPERKIARPKNPPDLDL